MEDGSFMRMNLRMTLSGRGPGSCDPISNFWDPLITEKTSKVNYSILKKFTTTCKVDCTYITQLKLQKEKQ